MENVETLPILINFFFFIIFIVFVSCFTRNRKALRLLSGWCRPTTSRGQRACRASEGPPLTSTATSAFLATHGSSLAWVRLSLLSKGKPELHAMVCVPSAEDLQLLKTGSIGISDGSNGPLEPTHKDHFKNRMKRSKKPKEKASAVSSGPPEESDPPAGPQPSLPTTPDLGLWPDPLPSVTSHCSRLTLGWVTQADFSLSAGCGEALGFVSVAGLVSTLAGQPRERRGVLLLRNPSSLHYRFAKVNIEV